MKFFPVLILLATASESKVIGGLVIPHGDFCFDPSLVDYKNGSAELHAAATKVGKLVVEQLKPNIILLSTPHGMALDRDFNIYENSRISGFAAIGSDMHNASYPIYNFPLSAPSNSTLATELVEMLKREGKNVSGLKTFADSEPAAIRWGEVVPLSFMSKWLNHSQTIVMSQPSRRYTDSVEMIPELLDLGATLYTHLEAMEQTVLVVISSDLAHTHLADGPYGYSNSSEPFDLAIGKWAASLDSKYLLQEAAHYAPTALSCGYTGLVALHGLLSSAPEGYWQPKLLANAHPTYYGMAVATFLH
jgi:aromatic ring-opening dioxygenase LigB subunit